MIVQNGSALAKFSDNNGVYPDTIALFQTATNRTATWSFLGCYTDSVSARTLSHKITVAGGSSKTTVESCEAVCHAAGYSLAGVEYSRECYCDSALRNGGHPAPDGNKLCNMPCAGNSSEICGGPKRLDLYQYA